MQNKTEMQQGWDFVTGIMGADMAARAGRDYVCAVEDAIKQLEDGINDHQYRNIGIGQLKGYMLEEWSAGTFNATAVAAGSSDSATVLHSTSKNSADIKLDSGKEYSAKSYATAKQTAKAQARIDPDTGSASYKGLGRLVPSDQLSDAKLTAHREAIRNHHVRPEVSKAYSDTASNLTDNIGNGKGAASESSTGNDLVNIAEDSKAHEFSTEDQSVTSDSIITTDFLVKQALRTVRATAAVTVAVQLAPEIYKAIDYLIKNGEIDVQQVKKIGMKGITAGAKGFLRGSISSALQIMCAKGSLGKAFINIDPSVLGVATTLIMQTVSNSILVAAGRMSAQQMGASFVDTVVISGGYLVSAHIAGIIGQAIGFSLPITGYLLGSLIGTSFCVVYNIGKKKLISFCADTGFTCFGLVEQDYEIPEEILHEIGVETVPIPRTQIEYIDIPRVQPQTAEINKARFETIDITVLRRGVIGVNKVGYVSD
ncbi:MAG: hypothetical protein IJT70_06230 [Clostridia bacterium]|nr:hypothetical protein [Clostridia bacterium]